MPAAPVDGMISVMPAFDKVNWRRITAEASAIALGVFLSLWADEWRSSRADAADGRAALVRIASDLERDTAALVGWGEARVVRCRPFERS